MNLKASFREHWKFLLAAVIVIVLVMNANNLKQKFYQTSSSSEMTESAPYYGGGATGMVAPIVSDRDMAMNKMAVQDSYAPDAMMPPEPGYSDQGIAAADRMIIRSGNLTVKVDDPEKTFEEVKTYVASIDGFIESANVSEVPDYNPQPIPYYGGGYVKGMPEMQVDEPSEKQKQVNASIRVPDEKFDEALDTFRKYGYVSAENLNGQDVTASYQDTAAQLENLKAREAKVLEFYKQAKTVDETLQIFNTLEDIRNQIDMLENQQKNLTRQVNYSTIWLDLVPKETVKPFTTGDWNIGETWNKAVNGLIGTLRTLAELGIKLLVYAVVWVPILVIIWVIGRIVKKRRDRQGQV